jgi:hypothetical protein
MNEQSDKELERLFGATQVSPVAVDVDRLLKIDDVEDSAQGNQETLSGSKAKTHLASILVFSNSNGGGNYSRILLLANDFIELAFGCLRSSSESSTEDSITVLCQSLLFAT